MLLLPGPSKSQEQKLEVVGKNEDRVKPGLHSPAVLPPQGKLVRPVG